MTARVRAAALAAVVAVMALGAGAPAAAARCRAHRPLGDGWTRIAPPPFSRGGAELSGYDVAAASEHFLVVTDGAEVLASRDGGCGWERAVLPASYAAAEHAGVPLPGVADRVTQVRFGAGPMPPVWAIGTTTVVSGGAVTTRPRVLLGDVGEARFTEAGEGLPALGRPLAIRGLGGAAAVLLLRTPLPVDRHALYVTTDGRSWTEAWPSVPPMDDFVVDTVSPQGRADPVVWAWNDEGVHLGRLGADRPRRLPEVNGKVRLVDLALVPGRPATAHVYFAGAAERSVSADGGATFTPRRAPVDVRSAATFQPAPNVRAVATGRGRVLVELGSRTLDVTPRGGRVGDVRFVSVRSTAGMPLFAAGADALYRRYVRVDRRRVPPLPPPPVDLRLAGRDAVRPAPPSLAPRRAVVRLRAGQHRTVEYRATQPPVPKPLDVFFLTDSTPSMRTAIAGVQEGVAAIVNGLAAAGIGAHFGVGDFRDFPARDSDHANYPYQRLRAVGPVDTELVEALEGITTGGGNAYGGHHAGLEAIYQAVTGAGRLDRTRVELVERGQAARFRPDAMKVVLVATDDGFRHPGPDDPAFPGPGLPEVSRVLRAAGVRLVGLDVLNAEPGSGRNELATLAADTGTVAPAGGVDCDGDGRRDLAPGAPMVCAFADAAGGDTLAAAFVAMLGGIEERAPIDLAVDGGGPYVRPLGRLHHPDVNVRAPNTFTLPVEFRCAAANAGTVTPVRVAVRAGGAEPAAATASFACLAGEEPFLPEPPAPTRRAAVAVLPPPPAPPAPVPHANPNPNPNPQPHPNPNPNPNAAAAAEEGRQHELALADGRIRADEELAATALDPPVPPVPALAWAAAFAMTGAAAYGLRRAARPRPSPALCRPGPPRPPRR